MPTFLLEAVLISAHVAFFTSEGKFEIKSAVPILQGILPLRWCKHLQNFPSLSLFLWPAERYRLMLAALLTLPINSVLPFRSAAKQSPQPCLPVVTIS